MRITKRAQKRINFNSKDEYLSNEFANETELVNLEQKIDERVHSAVEKAKNAELSDVCELHKEIFNETNILL